MEIADQSTVATEITIDGPLSGAPGMTDELVHQARAGSATAFEALVRKHDRRILALASRLTGRLEDAQDIAQEALSRLHKKLNLFRTDDDVGPWLRIVTVNLCKDLARRKARSRVAANEDRVSLAAMDSNPEVAAADREREEILRAALQRLTEPERTALVLRELEGLSTQEVAKATGVAPATVRVQIMQARLKLRRFLARRLGRQSE